MTNVKLPLMRSETTSAATVEPGVGADMGELVQVWWRIGVALVVAGQSMAFSLAVNMTPPDGDAYWIVHGGLILSALIVCALLLPPLVAECWRSFRAGVPTVEALFLVTLVGAFVASLLSSVTRTGAVFYEVISILLAVYSAGKTLGARSRAKAMRAVDETREQFDRCFVIGTDGTLKETDVSAVRPGDLVRVTMGSAISVDGVIRNGRSFVLETAMTGEWRPVSRGPGDLVLAGTFASDGDLEIETTAAGGHRRLDEVLGVVERARVAPSRLQAQADRLTAWFLPIVLTVSVGTFAFWFLRESWVTALFNSMSVLLVACPCALGLATPIAVWSGLARLAKLGLVARTGDVLDLLARSNHVCFDKTGTLSESSLRVEDVRLARAFMGREPQVARWIAAAETGEQHPVARALASWAAERIQGDVLPARITRAPGRGIRATVVEDGRNLEITIGDRTFLTEAQQDAFARESWGAAGDVARRAMFVTADGQPVARMELAEKWRTGAAGVFSKLRKLGFSCEVLTGDPSGRASAWADVAWRSGLTPGEKKERVDELRQSGKVVLFIGDGINDAGAMSAADVAVAMAGGAQLAHASAPAVFVGDDLSFLPASIELSRGVIRNIGTNIKFAAAYNTIGMGIAAAGLLHPVVAALLMLGSSAIVSARALRAN